MTDFEELKALAIARAEEAARMLANLSVEYEQHGTWITFYGKLLTDATGYAIMVEVKARGWKNASDAFVAAVTTWAQQERAKEREASHKCSHCGIIQPLRYYTTGRCANCGQQEAVR